LGTQALTVENRLLSRWRPTIELSIVLCAAAVAAAAYAFHGWNTPRYPEGMDADRNGVLALAEWSDFHLAVVDADKNGLVSLEEWTNFYLGSMDVPLEKWKEVHYLQLDIDRSGQIDLAEWVEFHRIFPQFYAGYDQYGYITKGTATYYQREFQRVDCNKDALMDWYEYNELRWNMRWCESSLRPARPWWK
jgi:hypothetical protein